MIQLTNVLAAWGTSGFAETLKNSIEQMDANLLPLQQCLSRSEYTSGSNREVNVLKVTDEDGFINATTGIYYTGMIGSDHCDDDPSADNEVSEYCEVQFNIDKKTAQTTVTMT